jgi:hydrogenase maturation protease
MADNLPHPGAGSILILALGNDVMGDDAVGLHAARLLRPLLPERVTIREAPVGGFELMELMEGFERVLIIDAIAKGAAPGTIHFLSASDFTTVVSSSPHYVGLPEVIQLAERLGIPFPVDIRILAIDVEDPYRIVEELSPEARAALPGVVDRALKIVEEWLASGTDIRP